MKEWEGLSFFSMCIACYCFIKKGGTPRRAWFYLPFDLGGLLLNKGCLKKTNEMDGGNKIIQLTYFFTITQVLCAKLQEKLILKTTHEFVLII